MRARPANGGPLIVVSALLFAGMALLAKAAAKDVTASQLGFTRALFGVVAVGIYALRRPLRPHNVGGLFGRAATGAGAVYLYFTAIAHLPVGIATLLNYTAPVFTALWCALLWKERVATTTLLALVLTTIGLVCVLSGKLPAGVAASLWRYELLGIGGAILSGLSLALITEVRRTDGPWEIFGAFSLGCLLISAPEALWTWRTPLASTWVLLVAMGILSVAAQVLMTYAMGFLPATLAGVINQITPVTSLLLGAVIFDERFGRLVSFGIGLTLVGGVLGALLGMRANVELVLPPANRPEVEVG